MAKSTNGAAYYRLFGIALLSGVVVWYYTGMPWSLIAIIGAAYYASVYFNSLSLNSQMAKANHTHHRRGRRKRHGQPRTKRT